MPVPESVLPPETGNEPVFKPETQFGEIPPAGNTMMGTALLGAPKSRAWLWIIVSLAVLAVGVIGYFTYPILFSGSPPPPPPPAALPPVAPPPAAVEHHSFFNPALSDVAAVTISDLTAMSIQSNLTAVAASFSQSAASRISAGGVLEELQIMTAPASPATASAYLPVFVPGFTAANIQSWFEDDFTAFIYYNAKGSWPGYVVKVKNGVNLADVSTALGPIEMADLTKFYLAPPGTFGAWKAGQLNGKPTRFAAGTQAGASFNYGLLGNYFVISTSFDGLKAAAPMLGL